MQIERIKFERTGGFAGIRLAAEINVNELPDDEKTEIIEMFEKANFEELSEKIAGKMPVPDEFVYYIEVESGQQEHKIRAGESALPSDMEPLLRTLETITKRQMRNK